MASQIDNRAPPGSLLKGFKSPLPRMSARRREEPAPGQRRPTVENRQHLDAVRKCPCIVCAPFGEVKAEAAHLRVASREYNKPYTGLGRLPDDKWSLPLCPKHHREGDEAQHKFNELAWWTKHGIDPFAAAVALFAVSPRVEAMQLVILTRAWTVLVSSSPSAPSA